MQRPKVIAEIGCNHKGDLGIALELIEVAARFCKADVIKFQKRHPRELLGAARYDAPHPNEAHSYGRTYGEHREFLEFSRDVHQELKEACERHGTIYSTSVWDLTSAKEIVSLQPDFIKVPSACNLNFELLDYLCRHFEGDLHVSLGMTTRAEEARLVSFIAERDRLRDTVLYGCTSGYPVSFEEVCLLEIRRLLEVYGERVSAIGFSGHHLGIAADIAALTLGATWIERHFTLDRTWKGTDHAASLEPDGLRKLVRDVSNVSKALQYKQPEILDVELRQREKHKWLPPTQA